MVDTGWPHRLILICITRIQNNTQFRINLPFKPSTCRRFLCSVGGWTAIGGPIVGIHINSAGRDGVCLTVPLTTNEDERMVSYLFNSSWPSWCIYSLDPQGTIGQGNDQVEENELPLLFAGAAIPPLIATITLLLSARQLPPGPSPNTHMAEDILISFSLLRYRL